MCYQTSGHQSEPPEDPLLNPSWEVGEVIRQYLQSNQDLGSEGVESKLKQIRDSLFEKMRTHKNNSLTWDQIVQTLQKHQISADSIQESLVRRNELFTQKLGNSPDQIDQVLTPTDYSLRHIFKGDWKTTSYSVEFVESLKTGEWSPVVERDPPPTEITHYDILIDKRPPAPIRIGISGKCLHRFCPDIPKKELNAIDRFQLQFSPYRSFTLARSLYPR